MNHFLYHLLAVYTVHIVCVCVDECNARKYFKCLDRKRQPHSHNRTKWLTTKTMQLSWFVVCFVQPMPLIETRSTEFIKKSPAFDRSRNVYLAIWSKVTLFRNFIENKITLNKTPNSLLVEVESNYFGIFMQLKNPDFLILQLNLESNFFYFFCTKTECILYNLKDYWNRNRKQFLVDVSPQSQILF